MKSHVIASLSGVLFGLGLSISQMINPDKVQSFLDISGDWDPSLLLVIGAATGVTFIGFRLVLKLPQPLFAESFQLPTKKDIDRKLILGAALFGVGWGLVGYCPGPGIAALTLGNIEPIVFIACLLLGAFVQKVHTQAQERRQHSSQKKQENGSDKEQKSSYIIREEWKDGPDI